MNENVTTFEYRVPSAEYVQLSKVRVPGACLALGRKSEPSWPTRCREHFFLSFESNRLETAGRRARRRLEKGSALPSQNGPQDLVDAARHK